MAKIIVYSLDYDGCLSNERFEAALIALKELADNERRSVTKQEIDDALFDANQAFFKSLKLNEGILMIGSNRQDAHLDWGNGSRKWSSKNQLGSGSIIKRIEGLAETLGFKLDKMLLGDLEGSGVSFDTTFNQIVSDKDLIDENGVFREGVKSSDLDGKFTQIIDDKHKVSLLFAQMQNTAKKNPDKEIEFNFYDDRVDIVEGLKKFYSQYAELIPKNVTLNLRSYSGLTPADGELKERGNSIYPFSKLGEAEIIQTIQGTGAIPHEDADWVRFYKDMRAFAVEAAAEKLRQGGIDNPDVPNINVAETHNPQAFLDKYQNSATNKIPDIVMDHLTKHLVSKSIKERQDFADGSLANKILATSVGHSKAVGRFHGFSASAERLAIREELKALKGDHLKRELLLDFKQSIAKCETIEDLDKFKETHMDNKSDAYKILAKGQGITTRTLGLDTDSVKALKNMIAEKRTALEQKDDKSDGSVGPGA